MKTSIELEILIEKIYQILRSRYMLLLYFFIGIFISYFLNLISNNIFLPFWGLLGIIFFQGIFIFFELWIRSIDSRLDLDSKARNLWLYGWLGSVILVVWYFISEQDWVFVFVGPIGFILIFVTLFKAIIHTIIDFYSVFKYIYYRINRIDEIELIRISWLSFIKKLKRQKDNNEYLRLNKSIIFFANKTNEVHTFSWNDSNEFAFRNQASFEQLISSFDADSDCNIEPFNDTKFLEVATKKSLSDLFYSRFGSTISIFSITYIGSGQHLKYFIFFKLNGANAVFLGYIAMS
jgi:hypothetical protein